MKAPGVDGDPMGTLEADFEGETVVVTGGTSGIGRAVALGFADAGAAVVVGDVMEEPKDADVPTAEAIADRGGDATFVEADVSRESDVKNLVAAAGEYGGVDVMVNNAAVPPSGEPFLDTNASGLDEVLSVNVRGVFLGTQYAAADMLDRGEPGAIVNTASISSTMAQHGQATYDASKGAVKMLTRATALELAEEGIRVNAVAPGQIATEFIEGLAERQRRDAAEDGFLKPVPLGRAGEPADLVGAYLYLASDAASYVTGELLFVDGGWQVG